MTWQQKIERLNVVNCEKLADLLDNQEFSNGICAQWLRLPVNRKLEEQFDQALDNRIKQKFLNSLILTI